MCGEGLSEDGEILVNWFAGFVEIWACLRVDPWLKV